MTAQAKQTHRREPIRALGIPVAANDNVRRRTRAEVSEEIASLTLGGCFSAAMYALLGMPYGKASPRW
jgi:hypothetical protein